MEMNSKLTKKMKVKRLAVAIALVVTSIIGVIAFSPYLLGMEITYSLMATVAFRIGFVLWGLAAAIIILHRPIMKWLNDN